MDDATPDSVVRRRFVLPRDVRLIPADELSTSVRALLAPQPGDRAIVRVGARAPSLLVDADGAAFLELFRQPRSIVEASLALAQETGRDPRTVFDEATPLLQELTGQRILLPEGSPLIAPIAASLHTGERAAGFVIERSIQVTDDSELYKARSDAGEPVALKVAQSGTFAAACLAREAAILRHLGGAIAPPLIAHASHEGRDFLAASFCPGVSPATALRAHASSAGPHGAALTRTGYAIASAYAELHARDVVHGDVHGGNILVHDPDAGGAPRAFESPRVTLVDFGFARLLQPASPFWLAPRNGLPRYLDPGAAEAFLRGVEAPPVDAAAEQFAVAALLFELFSGASPTGKAVDRDRVLWCVVHEPPPSFASLGAAPWPAAEQVLRRALAKRADERFPSMKAFSEALRQAISR